MATYTEIIGFDLGHAETALTKAMMDATTQPTVLDVQGRAPVITAVAEHPERGVLVGNDAYQNRNPENLRVAFKSPNLKDAKIRRPIKLFVQKIVEILSENKQIEGGPKSLFVVGCPSGWSRSIRTDYEAILRETGIQQVQVIAESHAAFLAARDSLEVPVEALKDSVLIIDMGSSTTDFTAVSDMEEKRKDFGSNELGAGVIDKIIFKRWLDGQEAPAEMGKLFEAYPQYKSVCLLHARNVKEEYFNSNNTDETPACLTKRVAIGGERFVFDIEIFDQDMDEILSAPIGEFLEHPNSELARLDWKDAFQKILKDAQKATADDPPQIVLLTGGASRMSFALECCQEVFPAARVERGSEPQFTIARGLAWAGRAREKTEKFRKDIEEVFESGKLQDSLRKRPDDETPSALDELIFGITHFIIRNLSENIIFPAFVAWREGRIATVNQMEATIKTNAEQFLKDLNGKGAKELEENILVGWIDECVRPTIERLVEPICRSAGIPSSELSLPRDFYVNLPHVGNISSPEVGDEALEGIGNMGTAAAVIGSIVFATLFGGAGIAIIAGPIGWIIGLIIGLVATFLGKEAAMDKVRDTNLWVWAREMLTDEEAIRDKLRKMIPSGGKVTEEDEEEEDSEEAFWEIYAALQEKADAFDDLLNGIERVVEKEMDKKAEEAEMLIK